MKAFKHNQQSAAAAPEEIQKLFPNDKRPFIPLMVEITTALKKFSNVTWRCRKVKPPSLPLFTFVIIGEEYTWLCVVSRQTRAG